MTGRNLTAGVTALTQGTHHRLGLLAELDFPSAAVYVWEGVGSIQWDGHTYQGTGDLGSIDIVDEVVGSESKTISFSISGVPSSNIALARGQEYQGRRAVLRVAYFDADWNVQPDPFVLFDGSMERMSIIEQGEISTIKVSCISELAEADRTVEILYDDQQQRGRYANDGGFRFVAGLQEKEIPWGVGLGNANAPRYVRPVGTSPHRGH